MLAVLGTGPAASSLGSCSGGRGMIWRAKPAQQASGSVQHNWGVILPSGLGLPTTGLIIREKKQKTNTLQNPATRN